MGSDVLLYEASKAVCCTKRIASIFKDLELKNSIYVRYAFSVDECTLGLFLEKGLPSA